VVAAAIHSTTDAVRFELDRLREETNRGPLPHNELVEQVVKNAGDKPDSLRSARIFLEGAVSVVPDNLALFIKKEMSRLLESEPEESVGESELAGVTFTLEQQFAKLPVLAVEEEVISRLNHFRVSLIRRQLTAHRQLLNEAQESSNDELLMATLQAIKTHETQLREPAYTVDSLKSA
jgi:hypothetical protein